MRVQAILHASFEPTGVIQDWAVCHGHTLMDVYPYRGERLLELDEFDALIIMGGPQSVLRVDEYPYLQDEMELIYRSICAHKRVLGFCLGAQLIGQSLGAPGQKSPHKEIGIWPIELNEQGRCDPLLAQFPASFDVMHWHSDMSGIPEGAEVLAYSAGCPRQIIRFADHVYGFQCHLEMTKAVIQRLVRHCKADFDNSPFVQAQSLLLQHNLDAINEKAFLFLDHFFKK